MRDSTPTGLVVLAAADPANPFGAAVPWPDHEMGSPGRHAGAYVALHDGELACFVDRGGRSALAWDVAPPLLATALVEVATKRGKTTTVAKINGESALNSQYGEAMLAAGFATGYKGLTYRR